MHLPTLLADGLQAAVGDDNFAGLKTWVLAIVGNLFAAGIAIFALAYLAQREFARFFGFAALAVVIGFFCITPDTAIAFIQTLINKAGGA